jgi:hypothetical protein
MKLLMVIVAATILVVATAVPALASDYVPWETYGQVSPDRVLCCRTMDGYYFGAEYAPYCPDPRFAMGAITTQCCPDRILAERIRIGMVPAPGA